MKKMDEHIDKEAALEASKDVDSIPGVFITNIRAIFPVGLRYVAYGTWDRYSDIDDDGNVWVKWICSKCGYVRSKGWENTPEGRKPMAHFCEMCGAIME